MKTRGSFVGFVRFFSFVSWLGLLSPAFALQAPLTVGLLPTELARPLLAQDPRVAAARAGLAVAREESQMLEKSPHEWTARAFGQRRSLDTGAQYQEWNVGVERTIRLPGKLAADRQIGKATVQESEARYGEALHESAKDLLSMWIDWLAAERGLALATANLQAVQANVTGVDQRRRAGDASTLDLNLAGAELAEQKRLHNDAKTLASATWARLSSRFPGIQPLLTSLPSPLLMAEDVSQWRERILTESDSLKLAQSQLRTAQAQAEHARASRTADPTLGVYSTSEVGGRERLMGLSLSMPLVGGLRDARSAKALAAVEVARQALELTQRELETEFATAWVTARGHYESLQMANEGARAMQDNAKLVQRAYALGEGDLQSLLLARRQATAADNSALQAQVSALKAFYGLLTDAHFIWDLEHD
jgi:cobalt-zinc-cadmium efflux system outer membrane protein